MQSRSRRRALAVAPSNDAARMIELTHRLKASSYRMLESRMVFDGAAADTVAQVADAGSAVSAEAHAEASTPQLADVLQALAAAPETAANIGTALVFIDGNINDAHLIAAAAPVGSEIIVLDRTRDGVLQIADAIQGRQGIEAIHIVSHGHEGSLRLGTGTLDSASMLGGYRDALATIGQSLSSQGDILIYGCDFTAGTAGQQAVGLLASLTGADVAASSDDSGSVNRGGDWDLESRVGDIDARIIDAPEWNGLLAPLVISAPSAPIVTGTGAVGTTVLWEDAGTIGSTGIDIRATVIAFSGTTTPTFGTDGFGAIKDDPFITLRSVGSVTLRWEIFQAGSTTVHAIGTPSFQVADIDGIGGSAQTRESVKPDLHSLTSYTLENPSNLEVTVGSGQL